MTALALASRDDRVWKALADPSRRKLLDLLRERPRRACDLAAGFAMSRFGVRKHLQALEAAGLVVVERRGRERWHYLNPVPIREIYRRWIRPFEEPGADRMLRLRNYVENEEGTS